MSFKFGVPGYGVPPPGKATGEWFPVRFGTTFGTSAPGGGAHEADFSGGVSPSEFGSPRPLGMSPVHGLSTPLSRPAESGLSALFPVPAPAPAPIPPGGIIGVPGDGTPPPGIATGEGFSLRFGRFGDVRRCQRVHAGGGTA
jgi:hypothetical protein